MCSEDNQQFEVKREFFGPTFDEAAKNFSSDAWFFNMRAGWMRRIGLDPNNPDHWNMDHDELFLRIQRFDSLEWFDHPDATRQEINAAIADYQLRQMLADVTGENYLAPYDYGSDSDTEGMDMNNA